MMKLTLGLTLILAGFLSAGQAFGQDAKLAKELKKFEGQWQSESVRLFGNDLPKTELAKISSEFKGNKLRSTLADGKVVEFELKLDPQPTPASIDLTMKKRDGMRVTLEGIYKFEKGKLILCMNIVPDADRPARFESPEGSFINLQVLTRRKTMDELLEPLNRRVGTWVSKNYAKKAEWTPEEKTWTGEETIKWVLEKKFIQGDVIESDGTKAHWLTNYDAEAKVYRYWFFDNKNAFPRGEAIGRWDAEKERMDWTVDLGNGFRGELSQFTGKDKMEWVMKIRDADGKLMLDIGGTQTRKK